MIDLTAKPEKFSSVYKPVIYTITKTGTEKETVQILKNDAEVIGLKQFVNEGVIAVNVAEYYRNLIETDPIIDDSLTFIPASKRTVTARIDVTADSSVLLTSGINNLALSTLLSNAPNPRTLAPGEWDELSYLVDEQVLAGTIIVSFKNGEKSSLQIPNSSIDGVAVLVVHYDSIAEALKLQGKDPMDMVSILVKPTLGCYDLPKVNYQIGKHTQNVRLAWWNRKGGIDYYSFKADLDRSYSTERTKIKTATGWRTVSAEEEDERNISSGALSSFMLDWLREIVSAPKVWLIEAGKATPIDITSDTVTVFDASALSQLELTFRSIDTEKMQTL